MKDSFKVVAAVLAIIAGFWFFRKGSERQAQSQDFPDGTYYICAECRHEFNMSRDEVADWINANPEKGVPCPKCEKHKSIRASKCPLPECSKLYIGNMVMIDEKVCCPICKKPVP